MSFFSLSLILNSYITFPVGSFLLDFCCLLSVDQPVAHERQRSTMTAAPPSSSSADPIDLNRFWLSPSASSSSQLASIRKRLPGFPSPVLRVSRVGQLDASLLDNELESILAGPIWKALELLRVRSLLSSRVSILMRTSSLRPSELTTRLIHVACR